MTHIVELSAIFANISLVLSLVVALGFGVAQTRAAANDRRERLTLETLRFVQTHEFAASISRILAGRVPATDAARRALPAEEEVNFVQFAQQMESLGMLVVDGVLNLGLVEKTLGSFVITAWEAYKPVFTEMRVSTNDPYLGEYFQTMAELMARRLAGAPRPPAYKLRTASLSSP